LDKKLPSRKWEESLGENFSSSSGWDGMGWWCTPFKTSPDFFVHYYHH